MKGVVALASVLAMVLSVVIDAPLLMLLAVAVMIFLLYKLEWGV